MGKPRLIILIRHAQSEGNKNRDIHQTTPDHRVRLTQEGWQQAYEAGRRLREMLRAEDTLHFFTSPYRRTRETTEGILTTLTCNGPDPSPFKRNNIKVYEEPRLREQDFGNFQPCSAEMERMWQERADYGHFFYRIPNGESAADAYDRISGFNESLWRQFGEDDFASVCVLVTHGLMSRVFLMKWYHFSVEYFEDLRNVNHCEFLIMRKKETGKYLLQNKLRTWSELRHEWDSAAQEEADDGKEEADDGKEEADDGKEAAATDGRGNGTSKDSSQLERVALPANPSATPAVTAPVELRRRWGGCPNGCDHDQTFKIRAALADLVKSDSKISSRAGNGSGSVTDSGVSTTGSATVTDAAASHHGRKAQGTLDPSFNGSAQAHVNGSMVSRRSAKRLTASFETEHDEGTDDGIPPQMDLRKAVDAGSRPDGLPPFIPVDARLRRAYDGTAVMPSAEQVWELHVGRDFGGSYSGHDTDADSSEDERGRRRLGRLKMPPSGPVVVSAAGGGGTNSSQPKRVRANKLGDHPHSSDGGSEADCEADVAPEPDDGGYDDLADDAGGSLPLQQTITQLEKKDKSIMGSVY